MVHRYELGAWHGKDHLLSPEKSCSGWTPLELDSREDSYTSRDMRPDTRVETRAYICQLALALHMKTHVEVSNELLMVGVISSRFLI
ncbi:hypothetical protein KIL84_017792 [Mauremys mutica]|uniref:Uncharacterized protein n=1 Tax=Mauremys mutica TaxID=74926 RepID=A0A9D4AX84_9SAUR|nr:hypothetical protein KIL84_017792 [Mauremys mutica]